MTKWPLENVRWVNKALLGTSLFYIPALIDIFWYVFVTLTFVLTRLFTLGKF